MTEAVQTWLFGGAYGFSIVLATFIVRQAISVAKMETTLAVMINMMGKRAAGILHSPHSPELDELIEKFQQDQITDSELQKFCDLLMKMEHDPNIAKGERGLAMGVLILIDEIYKHRPVSLKLGDTKGRRKMGQ